jgi:hypothetical protein
MSRWCFALAGRWVVALHWAAQVRFGPVRLSAQDGLRNNSPSDAYGVVSPVKGEGMEVHFVKNVDAYHFQRSIDFVRVVGMISMDNVS